MKYFPWREEKHYYFSPKGKMFQRQLELIKIIKEKSIFLLGPRQTGKSTLLRHALGDCLYLDLLSPGLFRQLASHPEQFIHIVGASQIPIVIDEIQLLPELLNVVHQLIETDKNFRFVLTGSSARKL